ncbi:30S ribosomal protein S20 [bacterium F11]|nr:30S ribosomal protein S20 [bacterium F11]
MRHASALKAKRQNIERRNHNFKIRHQVRTLTKNVLKAISEKNVDKAKNQFRIAQSAWKKAANRNIVHQNAANRQISRLADRIALLAKG